MLSNYCKFKIHTNWIIIIQKKHGLIIFSVLEQKSKCVSLKKTTDLKKGLNKIDEENENDDFSGI